MKIKQIKKHSIEKTSNFFTIESKVNKKKLVKLYGLLSNIYRNPIGSIVREYASNAYDANKEANLIKNMSYDEAIEIYPWILDEIFNITRENYKKLQENLNQASELEPVVVGIDTSAEQAYFYVQDYGIGLSPERMQWIYFNYLDSTKEETNTEIGGFGIGAKSALSYSNTFYIDTVYNNVQYKYMMTRNEKGIPQGMLLSEITSDSKLVNGTCIKVPIDISHGATFMEEIGKQLSYMENVIIKNIASDTYNDFSSQHINLYNNRSISYSHRSSISVLDFVKMFNESKIVESREYNWRIRNFGESPRQSYYGSKVNFSRQQLHISLGNISYDIDWSELDISAIDIPIALKFNIGELEPTPSRESIIYTKESKNLIKTRIINTFTRIVTDHNTKAECTDFEEYLYKVHEFAHDNKIKLCDNVYLENSHLNKYISLPKISSISFKPFSDVGIPSHAISTQIMRDWYFKRTLESSGGTSYAGSINDSVIHLILSHTKYGSSINNFNPVSYCIADTATDASNHIVNKYLLEKKNGLKGNFYVISKRKGGFNAWQIEDYFKVNPHKEPEKAKKLISVYDKYVDEIIEKYSMCNYEDVVPDPHWLIDYRSGKSIYSVIKSKGSLDGKMHCEIYEYAAYKKIKKLSINDIKDFAKTRYVVYGYYDDRIMVKSLMEWVYRSKHIANGCIGFVMSKTNVKIMEDLKLKNTVNISKPQEYPEIAKFGTYFKYQDYYARKISRINSLFDGINKDIHNKVQNIITFFQKFYAGNYYSNSMPSRLKEEIETYCDKNDCYDNDIVDKIESIEEYMKDVEVLFYVHRNSLSEPYIKNLLKKFKKHVD